MIYTQHTPSQKLFIISMLSVVSIFNEVSCHQQPTNRLLGLCWCLVRAFVGVLLVSKLIIDFVVFIFFTDIFLIIFGLFFYHLLVLFSDILYICYIFFISLFVHCLCFNINDIHIISKISGVWA